MQCVPFNFFLFWHAPAVIGIILLHKNSLQNSVLVLMLVLEIFFSSVLFSFFFDCVCCTTDSILLLSICTVTISKTVLLLMVVVVLIWHLINVFVQWNRSLNCVRSVRFPESIYSEWCFGTTTGFRVFFPMLLSDLTNDQNEQICTPLFSLQQTIKLNAFYLFICLFVCHFWQAIRREKGINDHKFEYCCCTFLN